MNTSYVEVGDKGYGNLSGWPTLVPPTDQTDVMAAGIFIFAAAPIGLLTNSAFLCFVIRSKSSHTPFNLFLSNLSVCGVLYLSLAFAFTCLGDMEDSLVRGFCFLFATSYVASGLFVSIVATERFLAVCVPLRYSIIAHDMRRAGKVCAAFWLIAAVSGGLVKLVVHLLNFQKYPLVAMAGFFCLVFLIVNTVLYACTMWRLWRRPLASTYVQRRVVVKLAATAFLVVGFDTIHVVYIILHYVFQANLGKTSFEMIVLALNVASLTVNPLVYGLLNFHLQKLSLRSVIKIMCCSTDAISRDRKDHQSPSCSMRRTVDVVTDKISAQTIKTVKY